MPLSLLLCAEEYVLLYDIPHHDNFHPPCGNQSILLAAAAAAVEEAVALEDTLPK
jgi:hypothetical protein